MTKSDVVLTIFMRLLVVACGLGRTGRTAEGNARPILRL